MSKCHGCGITLQVEDKKALGFTKKDQVVEHEETPIIMGMVNKISHLLEVTK